MCPYRPERIGEIIVSLTNYCNLHCPACINDSIEYHGVKDSGNSMSSETVEALLDFASYGDVESVTFSGQGEPFIEFEKMRYLIERLDVGSVTMITNGLWAVNECDEHVKSLGYSLDRRNQGLQLNLAVSYNLFNQRPEKIVNIAESLKKQNRHSNGSDFLLGIYLINHIYRSDSAEDCSSEALKPLLEEIDQHYKLELDRDNSCLLFDDFPVYLQARPFDLSGARAEKVKGLYSARDVIEAIENGKQRLEEKNGDSVRITLDHHGRIGLFDITNESLRIGTVRDLMPRDVCRKVVSDPLLYALHAESMPEILEKARKIDPTIDERVRRHRDGSFRTFIREVMATEGFPEYLQEERILD